MQEKDPTRMAVSDSGRTPAQLDPGSPLFGLGYATPTAETRLQHFGDGEHEQSAIVAEEVPVALAYNGRPHAVMMCTPADLEDFAIGFSLSEQIVSAAAEVNSVHVARHAQGVEIQLEIGKDTAARLADRNRNLVGRTSCGLCGVELIDDALREINPIAARRRVESGAITTAGKALPSLQQWNLETAAMHAAAWVTLNGQIVIVREDVGRHNALDKVLGALARSGRVPADGFILVTSRASYELVQKVAIAGIPLLAAVSRPTRLAIRLAEATGVALIGLLRGDTFNLYTDPLSVVSDALAHKHVSLPDGNVND